MIRIGIDARPVLNQRTGIGNYVFNLIQSLAKLSSNEEFILFSNSFKNDFDAREFKELQNCVIRHFRYPNILINLIWGQFGGSLMKALTNNPSMMHYTGQIPRNPGRTPSIATVHDLFNVKFPESVAPEFRVSSRSFSRALKKINRIIAVSEYTKTDLIDFLDIPEEKISAIPHGIETNLLPSSSDSGKNRFNIPGEYILCVGTLEPRKNYLKMLDAFKITLKSFPNLTLAIAGGDGWQSDQIHEKVKALQLANSIRFLGYVEPSSLSTLYKGASAFIFPSIYEGFGLPVLEALSFNIPIAISDITSLPEVAGKAALRFDPEDPEDIARQTIRLLEDSNLRKDLARLGNEQIKKFTWESAAQKTLNVYRSLGGSL